MFRAIRPVGTPVHDRPYASPLAATRFVLVLSLAAAALVAVTPARGQTPPTAAATAQGESVDPALMARASAVLYARELVRLRAAQALDADRRIVSRARRVGSPITARARVVVPDSAGWSWGMTVESRAEPMVWCLPNGAMLASSGLIERLALTDAELAAILAHAIGHALAGQDARDAGLAYRRQREGVDPDVNRAAVAIADILATQIVSPHYSEADEKAADALALELLARSGIDPGAAVSAWRKIAQSGTASALLALHPTPAARIANLEAQVSEVMPFYEAALVELAAPGPPKAAEVPKSRPIKNPKAKNRSGTGGAPSGTGNTDGSTGSSARSGGNKGGTSAD